MAGAKQPAHPQQHGIAGRGGGRGRKRKRPAPPDMVRDHDPPCVQLDRRQQCNTAIAKHSMQSGFVGVSCTLVLPLLKCSYMSPSHDALLSALSADSVCLRPCTIIEPVHSFPHICMMERKEHMLS
jgi:hypothetical protein